jgi:cytochrome P450
MNSRQSPGELESLALAMEQYLVDPMSRDNPYAMFARLRELDPVHRSRTGAWVLTRFDDVDAVLRDPRWSRWEAAKDELGEPPQDDEELARGVEMVRRMMLNLDDPDHRRIRRLTAQAFSPRAVQSWQPRIRDIAGQLVQSVREQREFDLLHDVGFPLPELVICELLGVPVEDHVLWKEWIDELVATNRMNDVAGEELARARRAAVELTAYFTELCTERRAAPRDDLVTVLVRAESDGEQLTDDEMVAAIIMLVAGGHETTANLVGNGMACLIEHPPQYDKLRQDPGLVSRAVEEMLRYEGPARHPLPRRATQDIAIRDTVIPAGALGLTLVNAANRDPRVFPDPDSFDVMREPNRHIAFGAGAHYCLGAPLGRMEAQIMFDVIIRELPPLEFAAQPRWKPNFLRALEALPVRPVPSI